MLVSTAPPRERVSDRDRLVRRGRWLAYATIAYNSLEGIAAITAGAFAGSISLVGFGVDSVIEVTSGAAALWRLRQDADPTRRERAEHSALRMIGLCFLALAIYIAWDAIHTLIRRTPPEKSFPGIVITALSIVVMPLLARAKRRVAAQLDSRALRADAMQTDLCMYLSVIVLVGLALNALVGWWWADPAAALVMAPIIAREGFEAVRGRDGCETCG